MLLIDYVNPRYHVYCSRESASLFLLFWRSGVFVDISRVDLNLLVYLDVLLRERNVTKAANHLGITLP